MWFRVVTNKDGGIASCDAVEGQEHDGKGIFYVDAQTPAAACLAAKQMWADRYAQRLAKQRETSAKVHADTVARGVCVLCPRDKPRKARKGKRSCKICAALATAKSCQRRRDRAAGIPPKRLNSRAATLDEMAERGARQPGRLKKYLGSLGSHSNLKRLLLREVLADFRRLSPPNAAPKFEGHLVAQIAELEAKRQQKPEPRAQAAE